MATESKKKNSITVAEYITQQVSLCGKSQKQIAEEAGFDKPNIITMFKTGVTKVPINRVGKLAKALEVDALFLLKLVMCEYHVETWEAIQSIVGQPFLTENELEIVETIRQANVVNPKIRTEEERQRIIAAVEALKGDNEVND